MEHQSSTAKLRERAQQIEAIIANWKELPPELEFPFAPDFVSKPLHVDPQIVLKASEKSLPYRDTVRERERRRAEAIDVEFVL
jgi:hypothetical protein